nr:uncharacterized mitochondrial protein AtMg00810-like [Tanacetum cinerariifolium]
MARGPLEPNDGCKSDFLYATVEEEVYVCQPPGFEDPYFSNKVYKVDKALYGLHQAPRAWYETMAIYLLENRFRRGTIKDIDDILLEQVYVDDIIFGSTKKYLCDEFEKMMHQRFRMSSIGELTFFLGLQVKQKDDGIFIIQDMYVANILKKFDFTTIKTASTLMEPNKTLIKDVEAEDVDVHLYRSMIGSLMYLTASKPDIMFVICACARFQVTLKTSHLYAVKRIFRYSKGQPKLGLWYHRDSPFNLKAFSDSDYAGASLNRKSITGGFQFLGKRLISWQCKKQTIVANSTTKEEYVAAASCCGQSRINIVKKQMSWIMFSWFWTNIYKFSKATSAKVKTINDDVRIQALVDGKKVVVNEASIRRDLRLDDAEGTACLPNAAIFEELARMGTMASAIICLANNQKFNFSKYILENMVKNLEARVKFFMFPRFILVFMNHQIAPEEVGEIPTDSQNIPILTQPSTAQPQKKHKLRRKQRKETKVSQDEPPTEKHIPTPSHDPPPSGEDRLPLNEWMEICTKIFDRVGLSARIVSSDEEGLVAQEDPSKQERIAEIDADKDLSLIDETAQDQERMNDQDYIEDTAAATATATITPQISKDELTLAQTLIEIKTAKPKAKRVIIQEPSEFRTTSLSQPLQAKDKEIMEEILKKTQAEVTEVDYAKIIWDDLIHKLKKTREKIVPYPRFISLLLEHMAPEYENEELTINPTQVFSVYNLTLKPNQPEEPPFIEHIKVICNLVVPMDSKALKASLQTEKDMMLQQISQLKLILEYLLLRIPYLNNRLEDLADILKDTRSAFFTPDSPTYEPIIVSDVAELKNIQWELPVEFLDLPHLASSVQEKLKTLDSLLGATTTGVLAADKATTSPTEGDNDADTNLKNELVDLLGLYIIIEYYNKKLLYERYCEKMKKIRQSSNIINCDVLTKKGPISLKVYKAGKRLLFAKRNKAISLGKGASKVSREVHSFFLKGLLKFKFEGDNIPIVIQPPSYSASKVEKVYYPGGFGGFAGEKRANIKTLVPNPSESEGENGCDVTACFTTFSNILFDSEYESDSSDYQSCSDEDFLKEIFSNPLFEEEIISTKIDPHHFDAESDLIESLLTRDSSIISSSSKIDSLLNEFAGELTLLKSIPSGIDETDCYHEDEIRFTERSLYDNSSPRPPEEFVFENSNANTKSFFLSPIPNEDSDSFMKEIDLSYTPDDPMPPSIEDDDNDSERDILILEELPSNYSLSLPEIESFYFDILLFSRPPAKPPDGNTGILNIKIMGDVSDQKVPIPKLTITRVSNQEKSPDLLSHRGFENFQLPAKRPMMIHGKNIPILEVPLFYFYPLDQFKYGGNWVKLSDLKQALRGRHTMLISSLIFLFSS